MSRRRRRPNPSPPPPSMAAPGVRSSPAAAPVTGGRRRLFRIVAAVALPLLLLGLLELGLRVAGYGYETRFFVTTPDAPEGHLTTNPRFGYRFFPPRVARTPTPYSFVREKKPGTYRIFLFGESAALGDPQPAFGMGRYLAALLETRYPQVKFEVIPVAMTAINSHALREIADECRAYDGDLWIVYMGNNEMAGPFGALSLFGPQAPAMALIRANLALQRTRLGQAIAHLLGYLRPSPGTFGEWTGLNMFADQALPPDDLRRGVVHKHFEANLRAMIRAGQAAGAKVLLCTVAVNLADCPPFASRHGSGFDPSRSGVWSNSVAQGIARGAAQDWAEATAWFNQAQALDPEFAELRYRQGTAALALTNTTLALDHLRAARDADALPFRVDSTMDDTVRKLATEYAGPSVSLLDIDTVLNQPVPAGQEIFLDHVHFDLPGNERVARLLAAEVATLLPDAIRAGGAAEFAPSETIERRLALTDWNRVAILDGMVGRLQEAPFTEQLNQAARVDHLKQRAKVLRDSLHPRRYLETEDIYLEAIERDPNDPRFQENYAEFLQATDDLPRALECWKRVAELLPTDPVAWYQQGLLRTRLGELDAAHQAFTRCLELRPDLDNARVEIAQILFRQQRHEQALAVYADLRTRHPDNARLLRLMADPLGALDRRDEVISCLQQAVQIQPTYWEAHYLLGVELGLKDDFAGAQREFEMVIDYRPEFVLARVNLGVSYVRTGKLKEAYDQFRETLRLDPGNVDAQRHLDSLQEIVRRRNAARPNRAPGE